MTILTKVLLGVVILVVAILGFASKKEKSFLSSAIPGKPNPAHVYYYYPKANFYYDSTGDKYICLDSSVGDWKSNDKLPVQTNDMGKSVRIGEVSEPVWMENQHHRLIYSVSLYSASNDFKKEEKPEEIQQEKSLIVIEAQKVEKKKGVRKFLQRIFPPKKKKDS